MISIIITARNEAKTIGRAIGAFLKEELDEFEIIVVAPDRATLKAARAAWDKVKMVQDGNRGKCLAMNLVIKEARGDKLIFSDGDVYIAQGAVKELLKIEGDLVSGRPVSINDIKTKYGWWQYVLVDMADRLRSERDKRGEFVLVSGYLFLVSRKILEDFKFPEGLLAEDEYLSYYAWQRGFRVRYAGDAKVNVLFPNNYRDWVKQKVRTLAGGYQIPKEWKKKVAMRSFWKEAIMGLGMGGRYVRSLKQAGWMSMLFLARLDGWLRGFIKVRLLGQGRDKVWQRVESTK